MNTFRRLASLPLLVSRPAVLAVPRRHVPLRLLAVTAALLVLILAVPWVEAQTNQTPTGLPIVLATAEGGPLLYADTLGIADGDGIPFKDREGGTEDDGDIYFQYSYRWIRVDGNTETNVGTDSPWYELVEADTGKLIKVEVSYTDQASNNESLTSVPLGPIVRPAALPSPTTLVSNTGQTPSAAATITQPYAVEFTSGAHGQGYELSSVSIDLAAPPTDLTVSLWIGGHSSRGTVPQAKLFDFENPASFAAGLNEFTAPAGLVLYPSFRYWIVLSDFGSSLSINETTSDAEDPGGEAGAELRNDARVIRVIAATETGPWRDSSDRSGGGVLRLAVEGSKRTSGIVTSSFAQPASGDQEIISLGDICCFQMGVGEADRYLIRGFSVSSDDTSVRGGLTNPMYLRAGTGESAPKLFRVTNTRNTVYGTEWTAPQGATVAGGSSNRYTFWMDFDHLKHISDNARLGALLMRVFATTSGVYDQPAAPGVTLSGHGDVALPGAPLMAVLGEPLDAVVQNLGQADNDYLPLGGALTKAWSQGFTTGPSPDGYELQGVGVDFTSATRVPDDSSAVSVAVHTDSGGKPGIKLFDLLSPTEYAVGHSFFEAPRGTVLDPSTSYVLVWRHNSGASHRLRRTTSDGEDPGAVAGFSIADAYYVGADLANLAEDPDGNSVEIAVYARIGSQPASGRPKVFASAEGAGILFADTAGIDDPNGLPLVVISDVIKVLNYSYQWVRVDADTAAETLVGVDSNRYQRVDADTGHRIKVRVSFTDGGGYPEEVTSLPFGPMAGPAGPSRAPTTLVSNAGQPADVLKGFDLHTDNSLPRGLWSDGTTIWVANDGAGAGNKLFAYKRRDNSRDSGKDFAADTGAGNLDLRGICSDGATMFVADDAPSLRKFFAYKVSDQSRDSGKDFNLHADNAEPTGVWCNESTIWVADSDDDKIYAYKLSDGSRDSGKDFDTLDAAGNDHPRGLWSDGTTMWVADSDDDKVYAYRMSDESRDADKDITLDSGNDAPYGVWSDGTVLLVVDTTDTELYAYDLPGAPPVGSTTITQQYAQGFRLGAHGQGYEISGVSFELAEVPSSLSVSLWNGGREGMPNSGVANFKLFDFANPSSFRVGENEFTAPAGAFAYQNVNYFIVLSGFGDSLSVKEARSDNEDAGGETGAVIFNSAKTRALGSTGSWYLGSTSRGNVLRMAVTGSQRDRGILVANYAQAAKDAMGNEYQEIVSVGDLITVEIDVGAADRYLIRGVSFHADGTNPGPTVPPEEGVSSTGGPIGNPMYLWDTTSRAEDDLKKDPGLFSLTNTRSHVGINVWTAPQGSTAAGANASYFVGQLPTDPRLYSVVGRYFLTEALGQDTPAADGAAFASDAIVGDGAWGDGRPLMAVLGEPLDAMVQNLGQADNGYVELGGASAKLLSQGFTTGSDGFGYRLQGIGVNIEGSGGNLPDDSTSVAVAVHADSGGKPGEKLFDLLSPAEYDVTTDGHSFFEAPPGTYLDPSTAYVLVWRHVSGASHRLQRTLGDGEDAGARTGAGIADTFNRGADLDNLNVDSNGNALEIAVYTEVLDTGRFREGEFVTPTRALVSNIGQATESGSNASLASNQQQAQAFTTGPEGAYRLDSVDVKVASASTGVEAFVTAAIYTDASGKPGTKVYDLITPAKLTAGDHTFLAPDGATLAPATTYFVVFFKSSSAIALSVSLSNDEDAGGAGGWSIDDDRAVSAVTRMTITWSDSTSVLQIRVNGGTTAPPTEVEAGWALVPAELADGGGEFRLLFLTSTESAATSTDIETYNSLVQAAAAAGHAGIQDYSEGFRAVASTSTVEARDNTGTTGAGVPVYWLGGNRIADSYRDFYDGSWDDEEHPTDETGGAASATGAWTGSESDGTRGVHDTHGSTVLGGGPQAHAAFGRLNSDAADPLSGRTGWREITRNFYALSEVFTVGPNPARITDLAITSDPGPDGIYRTGDEIEVTATFGAPVAVAGQPRVKLRLGQGEDSDRWAEAGSKAPETVDLVKNTGQNPNTIGVQLTSTKPKEAQQFTTGAEANGYTLSSIGVRFFQIVQTSTAGDHLAVTLNADDNGNPGNALCTLVDPPSFTGSGVQTFDAPIGCPTLTPSKTYFVVVERVEDDGMTIDMSFTPSNNEDTGGAAGWSIENKRRSFSSGGPWVTRNSDPYQIEVRGAANPLPPPPALVKNTGQTLASTIALESSSPKGAQAFTTGASETAYTLRSIGFDFNSISNISTAGGQLTVTLNAVDNGNPGASLCTLSDPSSFTGSGVQTFDVPALCPTLAPSTTYFVVIERESFTSDTISLNTTGTSEDSDSAAGWSISNRGHYFTTLWNFQQSVSYRIEINGDFTVPTTQQLAVPFTYTVQADDESDTDGVAVGVAGQENAIDLNEGAITLAGTKLDAVLGYQALDSDAGHLVNWARPTLVDAATSTDGKRLFLTFSEELNPDGSPPTSAFSVTVDGGAAALGGTTASVGGRVVALRLATPLDSAAQRLSVGYTDPSAGDDVAAVEDRQGNDAASFVDRTVTNRFEALNRVFPDHVLIPAGLGVGDSFRLLFLTSTTRDARATDIEVYNTFVRAAAAAGHADIRDYSGRFYAVASTADDDARDNTGTAYTSSNPGVPVYWLDGDKIADDYADFYDGTWDAEYTATDESGEAYDDGGMGVGVWTGTDDDGTEYHDPPGIGAGPRGLGTATNRGPQLGQINTSNDTDMDATKPNPLNSGGVNPASNLFPLYGLSEVFTVIDPASITGVAIVSDPGSDGNYETGDEIEVAVTFGRPVEIEGNPRIRLRLGESDESVRWAEYRREALVRNTGQPQFSGTALTAARPRLAQGFRTGGRVHELDAIGIKFHTIANPETAGEQLTVTLHADDNGNPAATPLCTLSAPAEFGATGLQTFAARDACPDLAGGTDYYVVVERVSFSAAETIAVWHTASPREDAGATSGWSIGDGGHTDTGHTGAPSWSDGGAAFLIRVSDQPAAVETVDPVDPPDPVDLVSNTGQTSHTLILEDILDETTIKRAQAFTTGAEASGYTLSSIGIKFGNILQTSTAGAHLTVTLNADDNGNPGAALCTLSDPSSFTGSGVQTFGAPALCPTLTPTTTYFVVIERVQHNNQSIGLTLSTSNNEDSGAAAGWSIGNGRRYLESGASWVSESSDPYQIEVRGAANPLPPPAALVKNTGRTKAGDVTLISTVSKFAQAFRTNAGADGYRLTSIGFEFSFIGDTSSAGDQLTVTLQEEDNDGNPGAVLCTLGNPSSFTSSGVHTFDVPASCSMLAAGTAYFVVIERVTITSSAIDIDTTLDSAEDPGGIGWSIDDRASQFTSTGWTGTTTLLQIVVNGVALPAEEPSEQPENLGPVQDLVSNTGQRIGRAEFLFGDRTKVAQKFTAGNDPNGYRLSSIGLHFDEVGLFAVAADTTVTLNADAGGDPGAALCTLGDPSSFASGTVHTYTAPASGAGECPRLEAGATYFVVVEQDVSNASLKIGVTTSDAEDSGAAPGWSIADATHEFTASTSMWAETAGFSFTIKISGAAVLTGPYLGPPPQPRRFIYTVAAGDESTVRGVAVGGSGASDDLALNGGAITVAATGADAPLDFTPLPQDVDHLVNWARPVLVRAGTSRDGSLVRLTFNEALETGGQVLNARFTLEVDGEAVELTGLPSVVPGELLTGGEPLKAAIAGRVVTLEPATPLTSAEQVVTVSYADPSPNDNDNVVEDLVGNDADSFTGRPVTNQFAFAPPPVEVPADWALAPEGLPAGAEFRLLFLSSNTRDGTSALIEDYDDFVRAAAEGGHEAIREYEGGFFAVASTPDTDARDNTGTTYTASNRGVPIYWLGGNKAADNYADFYDGTWDDEANPTDQSGDHRILSELAEYPWTGSDHDGTEAGGGGGETQATQQPQSQPPQPVSEPDPPPASPLQVEIAVDWSLKPAGLQAGDRFRLIFLSSATRDATSTDIGVYNQFVQDLAAAGHSDIQAYASQFRAVACTAAVDAVDNTLTQGTGVSIYWLDGAKAADDYADFYDGSWDEEATVRNQAGGSVSIPFTHVEGKVWSGCEEDGTQGVDEDANVSLVLGTSTPGHGQLNTPGANNGPLNSHDAGDASSDLRSLYALSPVFVVRPPTRVVPADWDLKPAGLEAGDEFRLIFLSSTQRDGASTDIGVYNQFVQDLAAAGHTAIRAYASQFRAVACTGAVDAVDNTGTTGTGVPIYWLGGAKAADDYADFYDGSWDEEATVRNQAGGSVSIPFTHVEGKVWSGCEEDGTQGVDEDANASLVLGTSTPGHGQLNTPGANNGPLNSHDAGDASSDLRSLYALSPVYKVAEPIVVAGPSDAGPSDADPSDGTSRGLGGESGEAAYGAPGVAGSGPLNGGSAPLTDLRPLYALSQVFVVEPLVVPAGSPIVPGGLSDGDRFRLLFLSDGAHDATSGDIADYNDFIQAAAAAGHSGVRAFSDGFRAVASTAAVDARGNTWTNTAGVPIYWLGGGRLAEDYAHFYDGGWDAEAGATDESGGARVVTGDADRAWTGSDHDGTEAFNGRIPVGLGGGSSDFAGVGQLGSPVPGHGPLRGGLVAPTTAAQPLYGLSPVLVVIGPRVAPPDEPTDPPVEVPGLPPEDGRADAPTGLAAEAGNESVTLSWDPVDASVTHYEYEQDGNGVWKAMPITGTRYSFTVKGLDNLQMYRFRVRAVTGAGTGDASPSRSATPGPQPPDWPTQLNAEYGDGWVKLTWTAPDSDGGRPITHYEYQQEEDGVWETTKSNRTTFTVTGLANGQPYGFRVQAANAVGPSRPSSYATLESVDPPPVVDPEVGLEVAFGQGSYTVAEGNTVRVSVTLDEVPGRTVVIPIAKANEGGAEDADYSGVPASVTFQGGDIEKEISFSATKDTVDEQGESVRLSFGTLPAGVTAGANSEATVSIIDVGEPPGATTDVPAGIPQYFLAYWPTQTSITLGWFTVATAKEYKLEYRQDGETGWTRVSGDFDHLPSTSDYRNALGVAAGLECNTEYHFRLSFKGNGEARLDGSRYPSDSFSGDAATSERTGECAQEERVTNLLVSIEPEPGCATLTWTPPSGSRDTGYRVERRTYTNNRSQVLEPVKLVEEPNRVAARFQDCSAGYSSHGAGGAEHVYTVTALDSDPKAGADDAFGSASTSLLVYGPSEEPEGPLNVRLTHDSRTSRGLAWDAPRERRLTTVKTARAGAGPQQVVLDPWVTGYRVQRQEYWRTEDGDLVLQGDWETLREETDGDTRTSFTDATDKGDRQYVYRVRAHNARGLNISTFRGDWAFNGGDPGSDPGGDPETAGHIPPPTAQQPGGGTLFNSPAAGAPAAGGTPRVGQALTASRPGIADQDGLTGVSCSYQWPAGGSGIWGATGSGPTLTAGEEGQAIQVRVTFTEHADNAETRTSAGAAAAVPRTVSVTAAAPATHGGSSEFTLDIEFREDPGPSYRFLKLHAFT